ncbi:MAG: hypothetical protein KF734_22070 [Saprospiraceae bacterium]|nr:hypothetical protein [Saprospiraceae bacterium]
MQINQGNPCLANRQVQILFNLGIPRAAMFWAWLKTKSTQNQKHQSWASDKT